MLGYRGFRNSGKEKLCANTNRLTSWRPQKCWVERMSFCDWTRGHKTVQVERMPFCGWAGGCQAVHCEDAVIYLCLRMSVPLCFTNLSCWDWGSQVILSRLPLSWSSTRVLPHVLWVSCVSFHWLDASDLPVIHIRSYHFYEFVSLTGLCLSAALYSLEYEILKLSLLQPWTTTMPCGALHELKSVQCCIPDIHGSSDLSSGLKLFFLTPQRREVISKQGVSLAALSGAQSSLCACSGAQSSHLRAFPQGMSILYCY